MPTSNPVSRRKFAAAATGAVLAGGVLAAAQENPSPRATNKAPKRTRNRVGAVAYGYQYSIGLFTYKDRPGERFDAARQVAATLHHIRGKAIDIGERKLVEEIDTLPHEAHLALEQDRMTRCIAYLKKILDEQA